MSSDPAAAGSPRRPRRVTRRILVLGSIGAGTLLAALMLVPFVPSTASGTEMGYVNCIFCPESPGPSQVSLPIGSSVQLTWAEANQVGVRFGVYAPGPDQMVCGWSNASSGSCSFLASGGTYLLPFGAGPWAPANTSTIAVDWSFHYTRPIIVL